MVSWQSHLASLFSENSFQLMTCDWLLALRLNSCHLLPSSGRSAQLQFTIAPRWFWSCYKLFITHKCPFSSTHSLLGTFQTVLRLNFYILLPASSNNSKYRFLVASTHVSSICFVNFYFLTQNNIYPQGYLFLLLFLLG